MTVENTERGIAKRTGFGEVEEIIKSGDIGVPMAVAMARAEVEARYIVAERHPRKWAAVEQRLMTECEDPDFALDKSTIYAKPVGGETITGLGARFAEAAMRCATNMMAQAPIVYEDDKQIHRRVSVTDLESNSTRMYDVRITKVVERKTVNEQDKHTILSSRTNSEGVTTFTIPATDDAMYNKDNSAVSKAWRNGVLALMPKHILKRCEKKILEARTKDAADNPDTARRNIIESFYGVGVSVEMMEDYLEHPVETCTPSEIVNLQGIYGGLATGEIRNWRDVMENIEDMRQKKGKKPEPATGVKGGGADARGVAAAEAKVAAEQKAKDEAAKKEAAAKAKAAAEDKKKSAAPAAGKDVKPEKKATPAPAEKTAETAKPSPSPERENPSEVTDGPPWAAEDVGSTEETGAPAEETKAIEPAEPAKPAPAATSKRLQIRKVMFPEVLVKTGADDAPSEEQIAKVKAECDRLDVSLEKTIGDWTETVGPRLTAEDISGDAMESVFEVLSNFKKAAK